jgi:recombination protein RecT
MAKKTVLKRVLKYAPLKSDFVKAVVQDESIKNEISEDMYEVKNETVFEAEYTEINEETADNE